MQPFPTAPRWWPLCLLASFLALGGTARAAEVKPFHLDQPSGFVEIRATAEADRSRPGGGTSPRVERRARTLEEEFGIAARGYLYHPNLANFDLAAGLTFAQEQARGAGSDEAGSGVFNRLLARLSLLENNSFPTTLYYSRTTPAVAWRWPSATG